MDSQGISIADQYKSTDKYEARFSIYRNTIDGRDVHMEIADYVDTQDYTVDQIVIDVGCGDLRMLRELQSCTLAKLIGVDVQPRHPSKTDDFEFYKGSANDLSFIPDHSVDCVLALFMLYHLPDPTKALKEFKRILKPDGQLIVATSGIGNKLRHRSYERRVARHLRALAPPIFSAPFNSEKAQAILPEYFDIKDRVNQSTKVKFTADNIDDYLASIESVYQKGSGCTEVEWCDTVNTLIAPKLLSEIVRNDFFWDKVERQYFICTQQGL